MFFYIAVIFIFPISFTLLNLYILFSRKYKLAYFMLPLTVVIGSLSYWALLKVTDVGGDWYEAVYETSFHSPISSEHFLGFLIPIALGYLGLAILTYGRNGKKPPLMTALSLASVLVMDVFQVLLAVQMCKNMYTGYTDIVEAFFQSLPMIYHINVIIISMYVFRKQLTSMRDVFKQMSVENKDLSDDTTEEMPRKLKADLVYFVMKPLEWAFLLFLYLFDSRPEMRIKNQYVFK